MLIFFLSFLLYFVFLFINGYEEVELGLIVLNVNLGMILGFLFLNVICVILLL